MKTDLTEISPFTDKRSVVVETADNGIETRICMDTGFTTSTEYKLDSDKIEEIMNKINNIINDNDLSDYESQISSDVNDLFLSLEYREEEVRLNMIEILSEFFMDSPK